MRLTTTSNNYTKRNVCLALQMQRLLVLPVLAIVAGLLFGTAQAAAKDDVAETEREQQMARAAERGSRMFEHRTEKRKLLKPSILSLGAIKPLFMGVDDVAVPAYLMDPSDSSTDEAFTGAEVWGAAYDADNNRVLFNAGSVLWEWPVGGTPNQLGTIVDGGGAVQSMVALAWHDGVLYGTKNISTEAIWQIDVDTRVATILITYPTTHDMGGLAVDPNTGFFYATDDGPDQLARINNDGTVTPIAPYPTGEADVDALAISDAGIAYMVTDQPGNSYVYDLVGNEYLDPITNPWTTSEVFSGATWIAAAPQGAVTITGQAVTPGGRALANVIVRITDGASWTSFARSSPFGYFRLENVPAGATYTITGTKKQYSFTPMVMPVNSDMDIQLISDALTGGR